jgi:hypothetical protein
VTIAAELGNVTSRFESAWNLMGIAEHFRAKTPVASVFEKEALPSQVMRT